MKHVIKSNTNTDTLDDIKYVINNLKECNEAINGIYYDIAYKLGYKEVDELYDAVDLSITKAKTLYAKLKN